MSLKLDWDIKALQVKDQVSDDGTTFEDAVCEATWCVTGTDDSGDSSSYLGSSKFSLANLSTDKFQDFNTLTKDVVLGWVKTQIDAMPEFMTHVEGMIADQISRSKVKVKAVPWGDVSDVAPINNEDPLNG